MRYRLPEPHFDRLVPVLYGGQVVVEDGGDVLLGEDVSGVADEQRGLSDSAVAQQDHLQVEGLVLLRLLLIRPHK